MHIYLCFSYTMQLHFPSLETEVLGGGGGGTQPWHNVTSGLEKANPCSASSKIYRHENPQTGPIYSRKGNLVYSEGPAVIVQQTITPIPKE